MLVRVVKMTFHKEAVEAFKKFFFERKDRIRSFEGCKHLELWQHESDDTIFFTYSHWDNEHSLSRYRNSAFFRETWAQTKQLFAEKAEAWSLKQVAIMR